MLLSLAMTPKIHSTFTTVKTCYAPLPSYGNPEMIIDAKIGMKDVFFLQLILFQRCYTV